MLAGPELDRMVAEQVMGWRLEDYETGLPAPADLYPDADGWAWSGRCGEAYMWQPSTDLACAWEVVERMRDHDHAVVVIDLPEAACAALLHYRAQIIPSEMSRAATVPLAICRAALLTVGAA